MLLKCLKYATLDLTIWPGLLPTIVSIKLLKELQTICNEKGNDLPFTETDLLFAMYLDQNCDAALKIMKNEVADLLDQYVISSNGTSLYIRAVSDLMAPFIEPCSNPYKMQLLATKGITVSCLWKRILILKKANINASKRAAKNPAKRGKFITAGCYTTTEILFAAAANHMLVMYAHFKNMGPGNSSPYKSGTKTTERIISELQGKTTQIQSLDAQPTAGDVISKTSKVQLNKLAEDRLLHRGVKKQRSTNRRRV